MWHQHSLTSSVSKELADGGKRILEFLSRWQNATNIAYGVGLLTESKGVQLRETFGNFAGNKSEAFILLALTEEDFSGAKDLNDLLAHAEIRLENSAQGTTSKLTDGANLVLLAMYFGKQARIFEIKYHGFLFEEGCLVNGAVSKVYYKNLIKFKVLALTKIGQRSRGRSGQGCAHLVGGISYHHSAKLQLVFRESQGFGPNKIFLISLELVAITFLCALHERLGANSPANVLSSYLVRYIVEFILCSLSFCMFLML